MINTFRHFVGPLPMRTGRLSSLPPRQIGFLSLFLDRLLVCHFKLVSREGGIALGAAFCFGYEDSGPT